jgi:hypothetical protein
MGDRGRTRERETPENGRKKKRQKDEKDDGGGRGVEQGPVIGDQ